MLAVPSKVDSWWFVAFLVKVDATATPLAGPSLVTPNDTYFPGGLSFDSSTSP